MRSKKHSLILYILKRKQNSKCLFIAKLNPKKIIIKKKETDTLASKVKYKRNK